MKNLSKQEKTALLKTINEDIPEYNITEQELSELPTSVINNYLQEESYKKNLLKIKPNLDIEIDDVLPEGIEAGVKAQEEQAFIEREFVPMAIDSYDADIIGEADAKETFIAETSTMQPVETVSIGKPSPQTQFTAYDLSTKSLTETDIAKTLMDGVQEGPYATTSFSSDVHGLADNKPIFNKSSSSSNPYVSGAMSLGNESFLDDKEKLFTLFGPKVSKNDKNFLGFAVNAVSNQPAPILLKGVAMLGEGLNDLSVIKSWKGKIDLTGNLMQTGVYNKDGTYTDGALKFAERTLQTNFANPYLMSNPNVMSKKLVAAGIALNILQDRNRITDRRYRELLNDVPESKLTNLKNLADLAASYENVNIDEPFNRQSNMFGAPDLSPVAETPSPRQVAAEQMQAAGITSLGQSPEPPSPFQIQEGQQPQTQQTAGPASAGFIPTPTPRTGPDLTTRQEGGPIPADNLELVNEPQKDMSGVADDVPRNLDEGDFVINAPAVKQAGKSDIEKMINKAVTELQRKGIKLDFGQTAEDIDKAINTLVSNGEVIIPKVLAEQIGYDRLEKINNRGKEKVKELDAQQEQMAQQSPTMQQPVMAQLGGAVGNIPNPYEQQNGFMGIAEQMPTSKFLTQTQVGQNIMQPTQQMQEGGDKIEIKKKPSITNLELVRNSLNSQNDIASLRPEAIAGILGNIAVETGNTFDYRTQQIGGPGQGLFQFEGGHLQAYEEYKRKNRLQPSINAQVRYVLDNIYNGIGFDLGFKKRKDLQKALEEGTTEQAADAFARIFERPAEKTAQYDKRIQRAKEIYDNLFRPSPQKSFKLSQTKEQAMQDIDTMEPVYDTGMMAQQ